MNTPGSAGEVAAAKRRLFNGPTWPCPYWHRCATGGAPQGSGCRVDRREAWQGRRGRGAGGLSELIVLSGHLADSLALQFPGGMNVRIEESVSLLDHLLPPSLLGRDRSSQMRDVFLVRRVPDAELATLRMHPFSSRVLDIRIRRQGRPHLIWDHVAARARVACVADMRSTGVCLVLRSTAFCPSNSM